MVAANYPRELTPERNLTSYLQKIRSYPILSRAEEVTLARRFRRRGDKGAANALVTSHLRLVAKIAIGYRGYGLPIADLIAEGNVGLMQAVRGFDSERGFRFATYALWWIRAAIQEYVLHTWSLVRIGTTAAQKKLFFNLRRIKGEMEVIDNGDLKPEQVARIALELNVLGEEVTMMNRRLAHTDNSLNAPVRDASGGEWLDRLADDRASQESVIADEQELDRRRGFLRGALDRLTPREKHILSERRLKETPATLQSLSNYYGVSRERIRQIEIKAFEKICKSAHVGDNATGVQQ